MDLAHIGFKVETAELTDAKVKLDSLSGSAKVATTAVGSLGKVEAVAAGDATRFAAANNAAAGALNTVARAANQNERAHIRMAAAAGLSRQQQTLLTFQVSDFVTQLASGGNVMTAFVQQGGQMVGMFASVRQVLVGLGAMVLGVVGAFPLITAAALAAGAAIVGMQYEIGQTTDVAVGMGAVVGAVFSVLGDRLYQLAGPTIDAVAAGFKWLWDNIVAGVKFATNAFINGWAATFTLLDTAVAAIPDMFRAAGQGAANFFLRAVEYIVETASGMVGKLFNFMSGRLAALGGMVGLDWSLGSIDTTLDVDFGKVDFGGVEAGRRAGETWSQGFNDALAQFGKDPAGEFFNDVRDEAVRRASEAGKSAGDAAQPVKALANGLREAGAASDELNSKLERTRDFLRDGVKGAVQGVMQAFEDGKVTVREWGNIAMSVLGKISDKLLDSALTGLFGGGASDPWSGLRSVGGGGFLGVIGSILGFAKGGEFPNGINGYSNSVVDNPTLFAFASGAGIMGEAGPEAIMPLTRGPDGSLGVQMYGNDNGRSSSNDSGALDVAITVGWSRSADGNLKPFIEDVAQSRASATVQRYDEQVLPYRVNEIAEDRRVR